MYSPVEMGLKYLLQTTPIFWIGKYGSRSVSPANLEIIAGMINEFLGKSKNPVVLLDGLEYLITTNGFIPVLKFLHDIWEWVILYEAIFILPVSPCALEEKELALIERNMEQVDTQLIFISSEQIPNENAKILFRKSKLR